MKPDVFKRGALEQVEGGNASEADVSQTFRTFLDGLGVKLTPDQEQKFSQELKKIVHREMVKYHREQLAKFTDLLKG